MSNYLEYCRAYIVKVHDKKSGRNYLFSVVAKSRPDAKKLVEDYAADAISSMCRIKKITKLPNKPQVISYESD